MMILEPTTKKFIDDLDAQGGKPIYKLSVADARKVLEKVQSKGKGMFSVLTEELKIPGPFKKEISLTLFRPAKSNGNLPVIMYFHGGGWILGSKETHERLLCELALGAHAVVVYVDYSRSPEAAYPVPMEEAYAATKYVAENGKKLHCDSSRLAVAGDSVGGNMAIAMTLLAKERKGPHIDFQLLFYPVTDGNLTTSSYKEFAEGPWLTKAAMEWFWNAYTPKAADRKKITASPLLASKNDLKDLPPALIITDENDVLRDEGEAYARKLMEAGVETTSIRYLGTIHDFVMLNPLSETPAARSAIALAVSHLQKAFGQPKARKKAKAA